MEVSRRLWASTLLVFGVNGMSPSFSSTKPNKTCSVPTYSHWLVLAAWVARMRTRRALSVNLSNIATPIAFVLPSAVNASRTLPPARLEVSGLPKSRLCGVGMPPRQNGFHQLMKPSHHEPGNNVVSRNRLGRSGRFPIIVISSERVPPRSKRPQERIPEQDFFGNVSHVSEHVGCIAHRAGGVIESPGTADRAPDVRWPARSRAGTNLRCAHQFRPLLSRRYRIFR